MNAKRITKIFKETAYVRTGGSAEERKAAEYLAGLVSDMGLTAEIVPFEVPMATLQEAVLDAKANASAGDIVTLSPACAAFDQFKNFMVRGKAYKEMVNAL